MSEIAIGLITIVDFAAKDAPGGKPSVEIFERAKIHRILWSLREGRGHTKIRFLQIAVADRLPVIDLPWSGLSSDDDREQMWLDVQHHCEEDVIWTYARVGQKPNFEFEWKWARANGRYR